MGIALTLHMLLTIIWVGGMFFAYMALRPAALSTLEPSQRLPLWVAVFRRFFSWAWTAVILLPITGYWMILSPSAFDGFKNVPAYVHIMQGIGIAMIAVFGYLFFSPYQRLIHAVANNQWTEAGAQLNQIRGLILLNLSLGLTTVGVATSGAFWP